MRHFMKIPALACTLSLATAPLASAQTSGRGINTQTDSENELNANRDKKPTPDATVRDTSAKANPKVTKDSRHCAANENFIKQGDHMVCVPRTSTEDGLPMGKEKTQ